MQIERIMVTGVNEDGRGQWYKGVGLGIRRGETAREVSRRNPEPTKLPYTTVNTNNSRNILFNRGIHIIGHNVTFRVHEQCTYYYPNIDSQDQNYNEEESHHF